MLVVVQFNQLGFIVEQKCVAALTLADVDAGGQLKLVNFINLADEVFHVFKQQNELQKTNAVVCNELVHLALFGSDFLIFIVIFDLDVGGSLEGLAYISH